MWQQLDNIASTSWRRDDGQTLRMARGGIDDGGLATVAVRNFCRTRQAAWVPMKGSGEKGKELIGKGSAVDVNGKNKAIQKRGMLLYVVGTYKSTTHLQGQLRNEQPGPGYLHLGQCSSDQFLDEIFPWKRRSKTVKGFTHYEWHLPAGAHDEGGDCTRMAYAALQLVARRYNQATMWDQLEAQLSTSRPGAEGPTRFSAKGRFSG